MTYGIQPNGFNRKPLTVILGELEDFWRAQFGEDAITTSQSPAGQLLGLLSDIISREWELAEDIYQSYDPDQAEGLRLDNLARLRLILRAVGESDASLRQAITNAGVANVREADFLRAVLNIEGVTWAKPYANETGSTDANGMPRNSVTIAALGGDDEAIASVARSFVIPGITIYGNTNVDTLVDGFCRTIKITRPVERRVRAELTITKGPTRAGCPAPSNAAIAQTFASAFVGNTRPVNGEEMTAGLARSIVVCEHPSIQIDSVQYAFDDEALAPAPLTVSFFEIATVSVDDVTIVES